MITDLDLLHLRRDIYLAMMEKSGVREWDQPPEIREKMRLAAIDDADGLLGITDEPIEDLDMPTKLLYTEMDGTPKQIVFADHAGDFNPTAANDLRKTTDGSQELDVQLSLASVANAGFRQSAKFDFGENWAQEYHARAAVELAATPTAGRTINCFLAYSQSSMAGTGNSGNASGSDAAYTGYSSNAAASVLQLHQISAFVVTSQAAGTVQEIEGWTFSPRARYACLIVQNDVGSAFDSDDIQSHIVLNPVVAEQQ
jgi:hypothetical protein